VDRLRKLRKPAETAGIQIEIRTEHLPNTNPERYRVTILLGKDDINIDV
jgi:hypothetical protein